MSPQPQYDDTNLRMTYISVIAHDTIIFAWQTDKFAPPFSVTIRHPDTTSSSHPHPRSPLDAVLPCLLSWLASQWRIDAILHPKENTAREISAPATVWPRRCHTNEVRAAVVAVFEVVQLCVSALLERKLVRASLPRLRDCRPNLRIKQDRRRILALATPRCRSHR